MNDNAAQLPAGMLARIIDNKQHIIDFYEHLLTISDDKSLNEQVNDVLLDEHLHMDLFQNLFGNLFGGTHPVQKDTHDLSAIATVPQAVEYALKSELTNYNFYGNIYFSDTDPNVRETFLRALFDENAHSTRFGFIFSKYCGE